MKKTFVITGVALGVFAILALSFSIAFAGPRRVGGWGGTCGPGGCGAGGGYPTPQVVGPAVQAASPKDEWKADDNEAALYRNGVQIGSWSYAKGYWQDYDARLDQWGAKRLIPPAQPPVRAQIKVTQLMPAAEDPPQEDPNQVGSDLNDRANFGVQWDKINPHQATYNGRKIGSERAAELVSKQIPDDSKKLYVVVIGTNDEQKEVLTQLASVEPTIRDRCLTWTVTADHWSLKDNSTGKPAFKTDGHPVIYVEAPDGKVLWRQDDAKEFPTALRKVVKDYDAAKDPGPGKPAPSKPGDPANPISPTLPWFLALGGAAAYFALRRP